MKKMIAILLCLVLVLSVLAGCGKTKNKLITEEQALTIALNTVGITKNQATDVHAHVGAYDGKACYSIHITAGSSEYEIVIEASTGKVLMEKVPS